MTNMTIGPDFFAIDRIVNCHRHYICYTSFKSSIRAVKALRPTPSHFGLFDCSLFGYWIGYGSGWQKILRHRPINFRLLGRQVCATTAPPKTNRPIRVSFSQSSCHELVTDETLSRSRIVDIFTCGNLVAVNAVNAVKAVVFQSNDQFAFDRKAEYSSLILGDYLSFTRSP